jgi:hypothetical protein
MSRVRYLFVASWVLCILLASGCSAPASGSPQLTPSPPPPVATPTVDLDHARQAFDSGGELTYEEVIALRLAIVGEPPKVENFLEDYNKYYELREEFNVHEDEFAAKLAKCKLKETYGWVAGWRSEHDSDYKDIPDKNLLAVYVYNPYYGFGKELSRSAEMLLVYFTDKEVADLKYGQRLKFSGNLLLMDSVESVKDPRVTLLEDEPPAETPTADELKDLKITLTRTMCFGTCPDYTVTVDADGKVTFEGRYYTETRGTFTATIDNAKLAELAAEIEKSDFFSLEDQYRYDVTDMPTYTLTVVMGGQSKRVESYATRPRRLGLLMARIDQILETDQWIGHPRNP